MKIRRAHIVYKKANKEYITELISLEWLLLVDSHSFFIWIELKKIQKQKYNIQNYDIIIKVFLDAH
jgi:hypothetical protein